MEMITLEIENGHTDNRTWFGSGAPETDLINRTAWPAGHTADQHDIVGFPQGMMPTIGNAKIVYSPLNVDMNEANWYEDRRMTAKVRVLNNGTADTGVARVKITTNKSGIKGGNVVGTAGLDLTGREEEKWIDVPIVIPNDENNGGTHNLTAEVRTTPDYIRPYPNEFINNSVNPTINETLSVETDIRLWADFIAEDVQVSQNVLNEQCYQEGTDGSGDALRCDTTQEEKLDITGFWENYGGITGDKFQANVKITTETDQSGACNVGPCTGESDFQNLEFVDNIENISGIEQRDFWVTQTKYIDPTENQSFAANEIPFNEPGVYRVAGIPHRKNQENSSLDKYENSTKAPTDQHEIIKVLDITHPESDANIKEKYFRCKNTISCLNTESAGQSNWNIWEGGMITFTGDPSKDNVRIVEYRWWLNDGPLNTGYTDCDGANCYSTGGEASDKIHGRDIRHRFNETGDFTLRLRTKDDPAYGTGAKVNTTGTPNTDTDTFNLTVKPDNNPPDVRVYDDYHNNPDNSPDSDTVWRVNEETQYDGIEVCSTAEQSDDEIGIESDEWWGVEVDDGDSVPDDTRCRFWETTGDKEIQYEAWDFANNSNSDQYTVDVQEDRTPPSVDLSVSKPNRWVEKDDWTNGITWSADTEDEETGLINCYETNNDPYSWFRDTNGDSNDCSTEFTTSYSSASESGTDFEVSIRARDYHGNSKVDSKEITLYEDKTDPSASGDVDVCSSGYNQDGCTAQACVTPSDNGPFGGIGISKTTGAGGDGCIEVTADANANADASTPSSCGDTNVDVATASDSDSDTATVTVYDYHGNTDTATISVSATDEDRDVDSASSSPCGNSSSGGSP